MDLDKLTTGDKVLAGSGVVFLLSMFLPWFGAGGGSRNGWDYFLFGMIPFLLVALATAAVLVTRLVDDFTMPDLPLPLSQFLLIDGGVAAALVLLKLLIGDSVGALGFTVDLSRKFGIFIALLAAGGVAAGAFLKMQEGDDAPTGGGSTPPQPF